MACVEVLLTHKAAINLPSRRDGGKGSSIDPLNKVSGTEIVKTLLARGANPNIQLFFKPANAPGAMNTRGVTPLIRAAFNVVALINHPEEIRGGTALHYATRKRQKEVMKLLASLGIDLNAVDQDG